LQSVKPWRQTDASDRAFIPANRQSLRCAGRRTSLSNPGDHVDGCNAPGVYRIFAGLIVILGALVFLNSTALAERYKPIHKLKITPGEHAAKAPIRSFLCTAGVNPNPPGRLNATIAAKTQAEAEGKFAQLITDANLEAWSAVACLDRGTQ
jgi:hypothetical protein